MKNLALHALGRALITTALLVSALPGFSQRSTFTIGPAAIDSTLTVFPQISETYSTKPMKPSNPAIPRFAGPPNGLSVDGGVIQGLERISAGIKFPGIGATGWEPPDPTIAAGPNHIVATVNSDIAFFSKTGTKLFQQGLGPNGFFASVSPTNFVFDPKVFYDQIAGRFVVVCPELDQGGVQSKCLLAVSDDNDPNGTWFKYRVEAKVVNGSNSYWLDYPGFGYNKDGYVITGNMFNFGQGPFGGVQFIIIPKAPLLTGGTATVTSIMNTTSFTVQVCHGMDPLADKVFGVSEQSDTQLRTFAVTNITTTPAVVVSQVAVPKFNGNSVAISKGGAQLDTVGSRLITSYFRANKIVAAHTVGTTANDNRAAVRWYEIDLRTWPGSGTPALAQSGQVNPPANEHYWMPGISVNKNGDITLVFSRCSSNIAADMMTAGRKKADPAGAMSTPKLLFSSTGQYGPGGHRWGDYAEACLDPLDDTSFWGVVMTIASSGNWSTEIQKWTVSSGGGGGGNVIAPIAVSTYQGQYLSGSLADVTSNNEAYYQVGTENVLRLGNVAAIQLNFKTNTSASNISSIDIGAEMLTDQPAGATGMIWLYNWSTGQWDHKKSFPLGATGQGSIKYTLTSGIGTYVNSSRELRVVLRGLSPAGSVSSKPFIFKVDTAYIAPN